MSISRLLTERHNVAAFSSSQKRKSGKGKLLVALWAKTKITVVVCRGAFTTTFFSFVVVSLNIQDSTIVKV
jgi:hypothetical protein